MSQRAELKIMRKESFTYIYFLILCLFRVLTETKAVSLKELCKRMVVARATKVSTVCSGKRVNKKKSLSAEHIQYFLVCSYGFTFNKNTTGCVNVHQNDNNFL